MNVILWLATGSLLAWVGYTYLGLNRGRSVALSIMIGAAGGLLGGVLIEPLFTGVAAIPGDFSTTALCFSALAAAAFLGLDNMFHRR